MADETAQDDVLTVGERLAAVEARISAACMRAGRPREAVTLVAVSKKHPPALILEAAAAGVRHFGENRLEEAAQKIPQVMATAAQQPDPPALIWHMVGHVQSRKARQVVESGFDGGYALLHSLSSLKLAERLNRGVAEKPEPLRVLLEINVSGEQAKSGWRAENWQHDADQRRALWDDVRQVLALPGLHVEGLMTMAPIVANAEQTRPVFRALRALRDALAGDFPPDNAGEADSGPGWNWATLSMGMTDDFEVAIEEGATLVRIGRAIFGPRPV